jgi:hypothetical protein
MMKVGHDQLAKAVLEVERDFYAWLWGPNGVDDMTGALDSSCGHPNHPLRAFTAQYYGECYVDKPRNEAFDRSNFKRTYTFATPPSLKAAPKLGCLAPQLSASVDEMPPDDSAVEATEKDLHEDKDFTVYLLMENLVAHFRNPCVLDLKMGALYLPHRPGARV